MIIKQCLICGKNFIISPSRINKRKHCSKQCLNTAFKGRIPWNKCIKGIHLSPNTEFKKRNPYGKRFEKGNNGKFAGHWQGGKIIDRFGYIYILSHKHPFCNSHKYVREHRLVMEKYLGRFLSPEEQVHHINGIRTDNNIKNLMLFESNSAHIKFHHSIK